MKVYVHVKQFFVATSLICIAFVFQACPDAKHMHGVEFAPTLGQAAILTLKDTIQIRYRDSYHAYRTEKLYPSSYLQMVYWEEADTDEKLTEDQLQKRKLQVQKLTNHNTAYILHGAKCYVNDIPGDYYFVWRDPSDTIRTYYQFGQLVEQQIPMHPKPCELDVVINALIEQYPNRITVLDDIDIHYIGAINISGENATRLTINL